MIWFGKSWGAPICNEATHVDITKWVDPEDPIQCEMCGEAITLEDQGVGLPFMGDTLELLDNNAWIPAMGISHLLYHLDCFLHSIGVK